MIFIVVIIRHNFQEAGLTLEEEKTEPFSEINKILESLKKRDVAPALQWAARHKEYLEAQVRNFFSFFNYEKSSLLLQIKFVLFRIPV